MIPSAIDQRTSVLPKRKTNTERAVWGFAAATRSSVSAIRAPSEINATKASAEGTVALGRWSFNLDAVSKTMPALVKRERAPGLGLEEVPVPEIGPNDALIRVSKGSICGTDVHIYNWDAWAQKTIPVPMVIGHEFVGVIEKIGAGVHDFKEGELVTTEGHIVCGHCRNCLAGRRHLCPNTKGIGVNRPGGFAEYVSVPKTNLWRCDPKIPMDVLSCSDPLGNAVHTALAFDLVGEDVLITGAGPIGCMAVPIANGRRPQSLSLTNPTGRPRASDAAVDARGETCTKSCVSDMHRGSTSASKCPVTRKRSPTCST